MNKEDSVPVIRGKFGATQSISIWSLVVGDIVLLSAGTRIPADCFVIEQTNLEVTDKDGQKNQKFAAPDNEDSEVPQGQEDCFLYADTMISKGMCKAIVVSVGSKCSRGSKHDIIDLDEDTPLQTKLKNLTNTFTFTAIITAGIIFVLRIIMMSITAANLDENKSVAGHVIRGLTQSLNYMVVIAVVSIPEGLPLAVGVSLAFSVMTMHRDNLLVRKLDAPEKMGAIEEIICGKSGTVTTGRMKVAIMHVQGMDVNNTRKDTLLNCKLSPRIIELLEQSIMYNTEARVEMDDTTYQPVGNDTEVSLLKFLQDAEIPVHLKIQKKLGNVRAHIPFAPEDGRSIIAVLSSDEFVNIYVKGAPEVVVGLCDKHENGNADEPEEMDANAKEAHLQKVKFSASAPLRMMSFAHIQMAASEF
jgi:Ca2+-transporting ATPase